MPASTLNRGFRYDALATSVWHDRYVGGPCEPATTLAFATTPDLYILTSPEGVPFAQDGLRDGEAIRLPMHQQFIETLQRADVEWVGVTGT